MSNELNKIYGHDDSDIEIDYDDVEYIPKPSGILNANEISINGKKYRIVDPAYVEKIELEVHNLSRKNKRLEARVTNLTRAVENLIRQFRTIDTTTKTSRWE